MSDHVLIALIAAVSGIISATVSAVTFRATKQTVNVVNGRMQEAIDAARDHAYAQGIIDGIRERENHDQTQA